MTVHFQAENDVAIVTIDRQDVANSVDGPTALALVEAFTRFDEDASMSVAILTGAGKNSWAS